MTEPLVLQRPEGTPAQLILLFHGVGSSPESLAPLGRRLATQFPQAAIVSVPGHEPSELGGRQWFSVAGVTEENRPARIADAMPAFAATVRRWQADTGASAAATALVGFSQGAIMALESTLVDGEPLCGRVVALSGRFAAEPRHAPPATTLHLIHGKVDEVIHYGHAVRAAEALLRLGGDVTADVIPFLGHQVTGDVADLVIERLTTYVPKRLWQEAMASAPDEDPDER